MDKNPEGRRKAILVLTLPPKEREFTEDRREELTNLLDTAGADVKAVAVQHLQKPVQATYIGKGKLQEVIALAKEHDVDEVVFDCDLTPSQQRNLSRDLARGVVDYSGLILHIFAQNARTHQAMLAVELAQLEYTRSRLKSMWTHLDRIKAGTNMRGPGEKQLESDRRLIDRRIRELHQKLETIDQRRERMVSSREDCLKICLVGYTNAGKSTVMRRLTDADVQGENKLFATLDTRTAKLELDRRYTIVLSDTVGFIRNLPHHLIASFHATLTEVREADLLLHVVDASQPGMEDQIRAVEEVLEHIEATQIPTILVFNKVDCEHSEAVLLAFKHHYKGSVSVSAKTGEGFELLQRRIIEFAQKSMHFIRVRYSLSNGALDAFLRRRGSIQAEDFTDTEAILVIEADQRLRDEVMDNEECECEDVQQEPDGSWVLKPEKFIFDFDK